MGGRLTCQACAPIFDSSLITVHAELFTLSGRKTKWIKLHDELLEVSISRMCDTPSSSTIPPPSLLPGLTFRLHAVTTEGATIVDTRVLPVETSRLSECFVQTVDIGGRTLGVNVISPLEADAMMHAITSTNCSSRPPPPPVSLSARGHSSLARIRIVAEWIDDAVHRRREAPQTTVVLITPVFLVFHYEKGLVHINLMESVFEITGQNLRVTSATRTWELAVADPHRLLTHILNQSSQILAKTSSRLAAAVALRSKMRQLRSSELHSRRVRPENRLRMAVLEQRIGCLEGRLHPVVMPRLPDLPMLPDCTVGALFLYLVNARGLSLWDSGRYDGRTCSCEVPPMVVQTEIERSKIKQREDEVKVQPLAVEALEEKRVMNTDERIEEEDEDKDEGVESEKCSLVDGAQLRKSVDELIVTEREYVGSLRKMISLFLPIDGVHHTLGCSLRLLRNQERLLDALEDAYGPIKEEATIDRLLDVTSAICRVFLASCSHLKVHAEYAAAYMRFQRNVASSPELLEQLKALNPSGEHSTSYESQMIRPVQRVARYPLLLESISRAVKGSRTTAELAEQAATKMRSLVHYVNEMQRIEEHLSPRLKNIRATHAQLLLSKGLRMEMGDLLMLMRVEWTRTTNEIDCFLFVYSSLVLLLPSSTHSQEESVLLPLDEVSVQEAAEDSLLLIHVPLFSSASPLIYHIKLPPHARKHLVKHIRKARLVPQRSRRPMSGSSKSDGGYGSDHSPASQ